MASTITLENLGYSSFFETNRHKLGFTEFPVARVITEHKQLYKVISENGEYLAKLSGKHIFNALKREDYPAVGDWVAIIQADTNQVIIRGILPRKTILKRIFGDENKEGKKTDVQVIGANIDVAFIVQSIGRDYNLNRFERYVAIAESGGIRPVIILNKTDLISPEELDTKIDEIKKRFKDSDIIPTSINDNLSIGRLKAVMRPGVTYCFLGSSGVGKSSLINALLGADSIKTEAIGLSSQRGKHVTTHREMYFLPQGGIVIDNPGIREVGMSDAGGGIDDVFDQIRALAGECKFQDCTHIQEPGCAVRAALQSGDLEEEKYSNYLALKKEADFYEMTDNEKRNKDRQFGRFLKQAKKDLKRFRK